MGLMIDNPDWRAVREGLADEDFDFWDLPFPVEHFYPLAHTTASGPEENQDADELAALVEDYHRVNRQAAALIELVPANADKYRQQWCEAQGVIERKVKKLLGNKVKLVFGVKTT